MTTNESSLQLSDGDGPGSADRDQVHQRASSIIDSWRDAKCIASTWDSLTTNYAKKHREYSYPFEPAVAHEGYRRRSIDDVFRAKLEELAIDALAFGRVAIEVNFAQPFDAAAHWEMLCVTYRPEHAQTAAHRQAAVQIVQSLPFGALAPSLRRGNAKSLVTDRPGATSFRVSMNSHVYSDKITRWLHHGSHDRALKLVNALAFFCAWLKGDHHSQVADAIEMLASATTGFSSRLKARVGPVLLTLFSEHLDVRVPTPVCERLNEYLSTFAHEDFQAALRDR